MERTRVLSARSMRWRSGGGQGHGVQIRMLLVASAVIYCVSLLYICGSIDNASTIHPAQLQSLRLHLRGEERMLQSSSTVNNPFQAGHNSSTPPKRAWRIGEFQCVRWVATDDEGEPTGETRECWRRVRGGEAGYCEIRNSSSGLIHHVMHTTQLSLKEEVRFTCRYAERFTDFRHHARAYRHDPPMAISSLDENEAGIVMAVYDDVMVSAYASIRQLRSVGCKLPIEVWTRWDEVQPTHPVIRKLLDDFGPIRLRYVHDVRVHGFYTKVHAVYYSSFRQVLLLDADNFAVRDPTPLFSSAPFRRYGAVFWPDFWHPSNTIFNIHAQSLLWELLGMSHVDMLEQESGQVLIDRVRSKEALERLMFFATHQPNILNKLLVVWGDKDLFRLAWLHTGRPFFFHGGRLPGSLGTINHQRQRFCGMSMVQYDLDGKQIMFLHRNTIKLDGTGPPTRIWLALQEYGIGASPPPKVESFSGHKLFNTTSCFGVKRFNHPQQKATVTTHDSPLIKELAALESTLISYATEASQLV